MERSGFKKNFFYLSRLLALLLLVCFISLLSDSTEPIPETLQSLIAAFPGDIRIVIDKSAYSLALYQGGTGLSRVAGLCSAEGVPVRMATSGGGATDAFLKGIFLSELL